jgi:predicted phosphodiesterase
MNIQLISDLHYEFWNDQIKIEDFIAPADVLVVAGDLAVGPRNCASLLNTLSKHYPHVVYVAGNHEYYGYHLSEFKIGLPSNVHFLNPGKVKIDNVTFIGATLWTDFRHDVKIKQLAARAIADFTRISNFSPERAASISKLEREYIKFQYEETQGKKVIITHFLPAIQCVSPYWALRGGELNKYFANDMDEWVETLEDTTWLFGHTHDRINTRIGSTNLISNPYGYHNYEVSLIKTLNYEI